MSPLTLFILKIVVSAAMVITITMAAEKGSPRLAGVLMGFPLGTGLAFFFIGIEQGAQFAADSALWAIPGILTALAFSLCYSTISQLFGENKVLSIIASTLAGILGYTLASFTLLELLPPTALARALALIIGIPLCAYLFQLPAKNSEKPYVRGQASIFILVIRIAFASMGIILITAVTKSVGPAWSGLFSTFPTAILPSVIILHYANGSKLIPHLFRETAFGMIAIVMFSIAVTYTFPKFDVYLGIFIAYMISFIYLVFYEFFLGALIRKVLYRK